MFNKNKLFFEIIVTLVIIQKSDALYGNCDLEYSLAPGGSINILSPSNNLNWNSTEQAYSCRYLIRAPPGYSVSLTCNIYMECSQKLEYFYTSRDALKSMTDQEQFCGNNKQISKISLFNGIIFAYMSKYTDSPNYVLFNCIAEANRIQTCDCGWKKTEKIVGGTVAGINEYISMAALVYAPGKSIFCGGAIIHYRHIISAAHCFDQYNKPSEIAVLVGEHDYSIGNDTPYSELYLVEKMMIHEAYNKITHANDIALVKTKYNIQWHKGVGPACLPFNTNELFAGKYIEVAGWGSKEFGGPVSTVLNKVRLQVIQNTKCLQSYPNVKNEQICTYTPGKDTCQFDSGGNLYYRTKNLFTVGIVSYGTGCASNVPSVNTRVTSYINWIGSKLNLPNNECFPIRDL